jgi:hypothetical protein
MVFLHSVVPPGEMSFHQTTRAPENFGRIQTALWLLLLTALVAAAAYFRMLTGFQPYDDEGTMMLSVKQYLGGMRIYRDVSSVYGPIYYFYNFLARTLTSTPVSHDVTRISSLFPWLACCVLSAGIVLRLTRSLVLAAASLSLVSMAVTFFGSEPGHPQELTLVLLIAFAGCPLWADLTRRRTLLMISMGALAGTLLLIKINIGVFVLAALALALLAHFPPNALRPVLACVIGAGCTLLPTVLMWRHLDAVWARAYCGVATASIAAAIFCLLHGRRPGLVTWREPILAAAGCALLIGVVMAVLAAQGVPVSNVVDSLVFLPSRVFLNSLYYAPRFSPLWIGWSLLGLGAAVYTLRRHPTPDNPQWQGLMLLKTVFTAIALTAALFRTDLFPVVAPFAWLVLFNPDANSRDVQEFPRTALCAVTVMQSLYAYPVYGSQGRFIAILMIVVAAVNVGDSLVWLTAFGLRHAWFAHHGRTTAMASLAAIALLNLGIVLNRYHIYSSLPPLDLPGAHRVHLDAPQQARLASIVSNIERFCDVFEGLPELPSLNFWTGKNPLTRLAFDDTFTRQSRLIQMLSAHPMACIVYSPAIANLWDGHPSFESLTLAQYMSREFKPVLATGEYSLLIHKERAWTPSSP